MAENLTKAQALEMTKDLVRFVYKKHLIIDHPDEFQATVLPTELPVHVLEGGRALIKHTADIISEYEDNT